MKFSTTLFLLMISISLISQSIERVEPPFWWVGMKNTNLQLMIYGEDIGQLTPSLKGDKVYLDAVSRVENENYLFLDLTIDEDATAQSFRISFKNIDNELLNYSYELKEREKGSADRQGFNNSDVIYLITPDRYANGDASNDNISGYPDKLNRGAEYGRHGGDVAGLINSLDYISDMGYTAIWLNPILENNMEQWSYHGYATTDYYKVDPRYGSNEHYREFIKEAERRGLKVIMDMIANHCGSSHWWMEDLPSRDWLNYQEEYKITNHRRTTHQDPYAARNEAVGMVDGWFVPSMPDLNQRNPFMSKYLIQNSIWWVEFSGIAGIRQDTYPYPDKDFMADWTCAIMEEYPYFNIVGEEWTDNPVIASYWLAGKENVDGYTSCLPSVMDFPMNIRLPKALNNNEEWNKGFIELYELMVNDVLYPDPNNLVIMPDNHDMSRIFTQLNEDYGLYKNAMAYILTMRGIPQIYYGTEIVMSHPGTESHGYIRSDFPGGWEGDKINAYTGEGLTEQQLDAQHFNKKLNNWRKSSFAVQYGKLTHYFPMDGVYVYFRYLNEDVVMVILNKNEEEYQLDLERFSQFTEGVENAKNVLRGEEIKMGDKLNLPPMSPMILEWSK